MCSWAMSHVDDITEVDPLLAYQPDLSIKSMVTMETT